MMESNKFEYNAPQFLDFNEGLDDSDGADKFFDVECDTPNHSDSNSGNNDNEPDTNINSLTIKQEIVSPDRLANAVTEMNIKTEPKSPATEQYSSGIKSVAKSTGGRELLKAVRRLSGIKKELPVAAVEPFTTGDKETRARKRAHFQNVKEEKKHSMMTREDKKIKTPKKELRNRTVLLDDEKENRKRKADSQLSNVPQKYVGMAEQVLHFQKDTPPRFRRNKRRSSVGLHANLLTSRNSYNPRRTIAFTPKLMTSQRSRPVEVLTQEQKEELELEEMKKNQVKAHPINEKILQPPKLPKKKEKGPTQPEPFKLTQIVKKPQENKEELYKFTAKPLPKVIFQRQVGVGAKPELPITVPESPAITKSARYMNRPVKVEVFSVTNKHGTETATSIGVPYTKSHEKKTDVKPFSFDLRDREMLERKERKVQEIIEAEKKLREFKANPPPVFNRPKESNRPPKNSHLDCSKSSTCSSMSEAPHQPFKARSPRVLRKPKFEVTLTHTHSEPENIELRTERRVKERMEFEIRQQEKQDMIAIEREKMEQEKKRKEAEEIARLRMEAVHKAQPMPNFKAGPKKINSHIPLTEPHSPCFTKRPRPNKLCALNNN